MSSILFRNIQSILKNGLPLFIALQISYTGTSQKLNFVNYSVEQGLAQSQPNFLTQDHYGFIWAATLGGISRFDGKYFKSYYRRNGLESQIVYSLLHHKKAGLFIGHQNGLQVYDGRSFESYDLERSTTNKPIVQIIEADAEKVYALSAEGRLFLSSDRPLHMNEKFSPRRFKYVHRDNNGVLYGVSNDGIYDLSANPELFLANEEVEDNLHIHRIFFDTQNNLWLLTSRGLYLKKGTDYSKILSSEKINSTLTSIVQDSKSRIWIGTTKGAYLIDPIGTAKHIGSASGLTDNTINDMLLDKEDNLWFATDADGIFKLSPTALESFDTSNGLPGNVVIGLAKDSTGAIWAGSTDGGLSRYHRGKFKNFSIPSGKVEAQKINALFYDSESRLWIGTLGGGLWVRKHDSLQQIIPSPGHSLNTVISFSEDDSGTVWITTPSGIFYFYNGAVYKINGIDEPCFGAFQKSRDTLLVGSTGGLFQVAHKTEVSKIRIGNQDIGTINCFLKFGKFIVLGTEDDGLLFWDPAKNTIRQCSSADGLSSDFIFSLLQLNSESIIVGTGKGISQVNSDPKSGNFRVVNFSSSFDPYGPECNLNAVLKADDGKIWIGTTKGIYIYNAAAPPPEARPPQIYLNAVTLFAQNIAKSFGKDTINAWSVLPKNLTLEPAQNHIAFDYNGVYFSNPEALKYRYRLLGVDTAYSVPVSTSSVIYPNISPGNYRFQAMAVTDMGMDSSNQIDFPFFIESPFYQKTWFRILAGGMLVLIGFLLHYGRIYAKEKQLAFNQKIRLEEQKIIMERTSEDLHDDLGNKITRITVLTDLLQRKMDPANLENLKLIHQIRENAQALYLGTKDIIWSLTPGNDNLYDSLEKCALAGTQLFEDTPIEFEVKGMTKSLGKIGVPVTVSRNLSLIIKETFSNILRHSEADRAIMQINYSRDNGLKIEISDNGKGVQTVGDTVGYGLVNMHKRMERIGGDLKTFNNADGGFSILLTIKIPPNGGYN